MSCDGYHTTVETIVSGCNPWSNIAYGTDAPIATVSDNFSCLPICHSRVTVCVGHAMLLFKLIVAANKFTLDGMYGNCLQIMSIIEHYGEFVDEVGGQVGKLMLS